MKTLSKGEPMEKKEQRALDEWSLPFRHSLMKGVGYTTEQLEKPLVGVLNGWGEINPGATHLDRLTEMVKSGIEAAGGTPMEFNLSSLCGGMAGGGRGSSYALAYRDLVADYVELMAEVNCFDAIVFVPVCDDVVPAHLMAAARLNLPSILVLGGYMSPKIHKGKVTYVQQVGTGYGKLKKGTMTREEFDDLEENACGNWGACPIMGTGNTMGAIAEALGMTLPENSTISGSDPILARLAHRSGAQVMDLLQKGIKPSDILTMKSFENAIRVFLAVGGSTNAVIHLPAIAGELGMEIPLSLFDSLSRETPFICNVNPSGKYLLKEFDEAGGLPALLKELSPLLYTEAMTVTGKTLGENVKDAMVHNRDVISSISNPLSREGGVAILKGSLAPDGAVIKISGLSENDMKKKGSARAYNSEKEACEALLRGEVKPGDMVVLRYLGPKGDPGMRIAGARFLWLLAGMNLETAITLISDGRFSGTNKGGAVGHVSPEAQVGGPIALVRNGDMIELNIPERKVDLLVPEEELDKRRSSWKAPQPKFKRGFLSRIEATMGPIEKGGTLRTQF
jgi:dihydroxy-acid dehydratase